MKSYRKNVVLSILLSIIFLTGCGDTTYDADTPDNSSQTAIAAEDSVNGTAEAETETETDAAPVRAICLPLNQTKANLLQNTLVTAGEYLNGNITPEKSYELNFDNSTYVLVVEVTLPTYTSEMEDCLTQNKLFLSCKTKQTIDFNTSIVKIANIVEFGENRSYSGTTYIDQTQNLLFCFDDEAITSDFICCIAVDPATNEINFADYDHGKATYGTISSVDILQPISSHRYLFFYQLCNTSADDNLKDADEESVTSDVSFNDPENQEATEN